MNVQQAWNAFPACAKIVGETVPSRAVYAHGKRDGWRLALRTDVKGRTQALTRGYEEIKGVLTKQYLDWARPSTLVWVEAWYPGQKARKPGPGCKLSLIAAPLVDETPFVDEDDELCMHCSIVANATGLWFDHPLIVHEESMNLEGWLNVAKIRGYEGWVFKESHYANWWKLKPKPTIRLRFVEIVPGKTGKRIGGVGSLRCALEDGTVVCDASGMNEETRASITQADVGRVCEVEYQYVGAGGRLRHPQFRRWRDDLNEAATELPT